MGSAVGRAGGRQGTISKENLGGKFAASGYRVLRNTAVPHFYSGLMPSCLYLCVQRKTKHSYYVQSDTNVENF